ncbi:MAG: 2-oxoglutarate/2-oxoacid ferredoxin oxidoreductase subunit beta [Clostridia bacterium]|nr:2-oxoglutarate/2-oxoacid ferredoxin oxidoreductase subunit beta [Clostridia bacterium]
MNFNTLHTTHGRAIPFATGLKLARPELTVIVITGDGDAAAIGGNHLIHAARRNIDLTAVCFNNNIYGMTSGQYSPLTPKSKKAATAPYGNIENNFDLCRLVIAAGASYVARGTAYHVRSLIRLITRGIRHRGFAFIEALSPCPTYYGRINGLDSAISMLQWQKEHALDIKAASRKRPYELEDKIIIGELFNSEARGLNIPEFSQEYWNLIKRVKDK